MTFGSFSGFSATFPLMIKEIYGVFDGAPDPLKYAFWGPLIGSTIRVLTGPITDRIGGAIVTQVAGIGLILCAGATVGMGLLTPTTLAQFDAFFWLMMGIFLFAGIGNASTFRQYPIIFAHSPRQGAGVLGWTGAVGAYGPFVFSALIGKSITAFGSAAPFFVGVCAFYVFATAINWWYYTRRGCERPC
jgi:NNP family nitrate/nitrite transporter-like MFS transporter